MTDYLVTLDINLASPIELEVNSLSDSCDDSKCSTTFNISQPRGNYQVFVDVVTIVGRNRTTLPSLSRKSGVLYCGGSMSPDNMLQLPVLIHYFSHPSSLSTVSPMPPAPRPLLGQENVLLATAQSLMLELQLEHLMINFHCLYLTPLPHIDL